MRNIIVLRDVLESEVKYEVSMVLSVNFKILSYRMVSQTDVIL